MNNNEEITTDVAEDDMAWEHVESSSSPTATTSTRPSYTTSLWNSYRQFVHRHHVSLGLADEGLSRILFWAPTASSSSTKNSRTADQRHRQREVLYGILSLHRLAMDTALQQQQQQLQRQATDNAATSRDSTNNQDLLPRDYGMTMRPTSYGEDGDIDAGASGVPGRSKVIEGWNKGTLLLRRISPTTVRIAMTVVQSLLPSILEVSYSYSLSEQQNNQRRGRVRLYLERVKFALRLMLLGSYWRRLIAQHQVKRQILLEQGENPSNCIPPLCVGIMTEGGLFHGIDNTGDSIPTAAQEDALWRRRKYVGRRTGRTVLRRSPKGKKEEPTLLPNNDSRAQPQSTANSFAPSLVAVKDNLPGLAVMAGELLHAYRPLYWAGAERTGPASYRSWVLSIAMDLVSLQCSRANCSTSVNPATQAELSRRRMRLLLYLLRSPVWDRWTMPASDRAEGILEKVPILGRLASTYLRDYLLYMKHPYESEKG